MGEATQTILLHILSAGSMALGYLAVPEGSPGPEGPPQHLLLHICLIVWMGHDPSGLVCARISSGSMLPVPVNVWL